MCYEKHYCNLVALFSKSIIGFIILIQKEGRDNASKKVRKTERICFRLAEKENRELERQAKEHGLTVPQFIRQVLRTSPKDYSDTQELIRELTQYINTRGVKINEIAKRHNAGWDFEWDKKMRDEKWEEAFNDARDGVCEVHSTS